LATAMCRWCACRRDVSVSARFTYLRLLDFSDCYYSRSGLLDHLSSDGFDYWSNRLLFHFARGFLRWRTFGLPRLLGFSPVDMDV
jgi:hypothetical protein